jgi:hypothetical protein
MRIIYAPGVQFTVSNDHPIAKAIVELARFYKAEIAPAVNMPERNDIKNLWWELSDSHREFLGEVAKGPAIGISQSELEQNLNLDWQGLRGVHNGLARICERVGCEKPVRVVGYNAQNRRYHMDPDVRATIQGLTE